MFHYESGCVGQQRVHAKAFLCRIVCLPLRRGEIDSTRFLKIELCNSQHLEAPRSFRDCLDASSQLEATARRAGFSISKEGEQNIIIAMLMLFNSLFS